MTKFWACHRVNPQVTNEKFGQACHSHRGLTNCSKFYSILYDHSESTLFVLVENQSLRPNQAVQFSSSFTGLELRDHTKHAVMEADIITKRLHISGLTPSITPTDLTRRLSSFGTVKALDGFGQFDAVGQPRKFGYVTLEGTKGHLAKCKFFC